MYMKKTLLTATMLVAYICGQACTNFIVGKDASADGSVFCGLLFLCEEIV